MHMLSHACLRACKHRYTHVYTDTCDLGQDPDQCFAYPTCPQRRASSKFQFSKIRPTGNEIRDLPPPSDRCQVPSSEGKASPPLPEQSMLFPEDFPFLEPITSSVVTSRARNMVRIQGQFQRCPNTARPWPLVRTTHFGI